MQVLRSGPVQIPRSSFRLSVSENGRCVRFVRGVGGLLVRGHDTILTARDDGDMFGTFIIITIIMRSSHIHAFMELALVSPVSTYQACWEPNFRLTSLSHVCLFVLVCVSIRISWHISKSHKGW